MQTNHREDKMTPEQETIYIETKKRNLKRKLSRLAQHPELLEEYQQTKQELTNLS
jgi:hypothetical protein